MKYDLACFVCLTFISAAMWGTGTTNGQLKLALNWKAEPEFGGFYQTDVDHLFHQQDMDMKITEGASGAPTIQMIEAAQVDYAIVSADELVLSYDHGGKNVVALLAVYQTNPQAILTHAEKNYKTLSDLFADKDATLLWGEGQPFVEYLKKKYAANWKVKTAPYAGGIGIFQKDGNVAQQGFLTSEPLLADKANIKQKTFLISDVGFNPYTTVLVTTQDKIKNHKDEVTKVVKIFRDGWKLYLKDPTAANEWMRHLNPAMDATTFAKSAQVQEPLIETQETKKNGMGTMTRKRWQDLIDQMKSIGQIKTSPKASELFINL